ncbi:MAG TPA: indolepyruvate ferredoxin oxidoreductase subunit alpha, partial [Methanomicrobiales archaeon]|nr:indolepyruvate ferredoxin oxidoreductase subunit alpha [Methanomicrobiales archaeon]
LGNEGIAHAAIEASADFVSGYPGTPSSEVIDILRAQEERPLYVEWSVNEKVAFENALAAAWCGLRALVTMKHVGLNVAADPLMTSGYTGVNGGFVIMSADDPFAHSSQNEQDTRMYARFAHLPCLDPSTVQEAHDMVIDAFALSEELGLPVIFRPTTRICHSRSDVTIGEAGAGSRKAEFPRDPKRFVLIPANARPLHKALDEKEPKVVRTLADRGYNRFEKKGKTAVVAGGIGVTYALEALPAGVSFGKIGAYPVDMEALRSFISGHRKVLVIEEGEPVIEELVRQVAGDVPVSGKLDGAVPKEGELSLAAVSAILAAQGFIPKPSAAVPVPVPNVPMRPPIMCAGCMHRPTFYAMKRVWRDAVYPSDIGCYTLGLQLGMVDTTICMGSAPSLGSGINHAGDPREVVATIGDSTFLHSGIPGLLNAVYNGAEMTLVILDNRTTAMTGHQPNPVSGSTAAGAARAPVSLEAICRACGVSFVETVSPYDIPSMVEVMKAAKAQKGVKVVIAKQPCVITARRAGVRRVSYAVDRDACTVCGTCVRFGCPAIEMVDDRAAINELCSGCGVCAAICPSGAIGPAEKEKETKGAKGAKA